MTPAERALLDALITARNALAALAVQCGYLPTFQAYSTRFTEPERQAAEAVAALDSIIDQYD